MPGWQLLVQSAQMWNMFTSRRGCEVTIKLQSLMRNRNLITYSSIAVISAVVAFGVQYFFLPHSFFLSTYTRRVYVPNLGDVTIDSDENVIEGAEGEVQISIKRRLQPARESVTETVTVRVDSEDSELQFSPHFFVFSLSHETSSGSFSFITTKAGLHKADLFIGPTDSKMPAFSDTVMPEAIYIQALPTLAHRIRLGAEMFILLFVFSVFAWHYIARKREHEKRIEQKVEQAENKAQAEPEKPKYAWDAARINLEAYFERNRLQVRQVFGIAIVVMSIGFILVCIGVYLAMTRPDTIKPALVAGVSGIITQFIGATFMVIYRSTMTQANEFMVILERINTVGMAIQVLELIPEGEAALKNESRAKIVELLLSASVSTKTKKRKMADT